MVGTFLSIKKGEGTIWGRLSQVQRGKNRVSGVDLPRSKTADSITVTYLHGVRGRGPHTSIPVLLLAADLRHDVTGGKEVSSTKFSMSVVGRTMPSVLRWIIENVRERGEISTVRYLCDTISVEDNRQVVAITPHYDISGACVVHPSEEVTTVGVLLSKRYLLLTIILWLPFGTRNLRPNYMAHQPHVRVISCKLKICRGGHLYQTVRRFKLNLIDSSGRCIWAMTTTNLGIYPEVKRQLTVSHPIIRLRQFNAAYYKPENGTASARMLTWKFRRSEHDHNHNYKSRVHQNHAL